MIKMMMVKSDPVLPSSFVRRLSILLSRLKPSVIGRYCNDWELTARIVKAVWRLHMLVHTIIRERAYALMKNCLNSCSLFITNRMMVAVILYGVKYWQKGHCYYNKYCSVFEYRIVSCYGFSAVCFGNYVDRCSPI